MQEKIVIEILKLKRLTPKRYRKILGRYPKESNRFYQKSEILAAYHQMAQRGTIAKREDIENFLKKKPTRTISGVVPVTVLTKPYPCCSNCIFCPSAADQPKSYLSSEPGAMRAKMLAFDPFRQITVRIQALDNIGHNTEKVEVIILGGTWSHYPKKYQAWFIREIFRGLNRAGKVSVDEGSLRKISVGAERDNPQAEGIEDVSLADLRKQIVEEQIANETAQHRCVGLVIETRPDLITEDALKWLRFLGVTKVQMGVQTLDDKILDLNKRDHSVADTQEAFKLLRLAGFKTHVHWMMNLYGSTPQKDYEDFKQLFDDERYRPDELKVYPCLLLKETRLFDYYTSGKYRPYSRRELLELLIKCKLAVPNYCRISRLYRDIPSFEIVDGVKEGNFRQVVQKEMAARGLHCNCVRCREIRGEAVDQSLVSLQNLRYNTDTGQEYFLSYETDQGKIIGFLRLSLPRRSKSKTHFLEELQGSAIIREVHVYGVSRNIQEDEKTGRAQHAGLGKKLVREAERIAKQEKYNQISVISAVGTRKYYEKLGYRLKSLYMHKLIE